MSNEMKGKMEKVQPLFSNIQTSFIKYALLFPIISYFVFDFLKY